MLRTTRSKNQEKYSESEFERCLSGEWKPGTQAPESKAEEARHRLTQDGCGRMS
jgi:hypothetical protein